MVQFAANGLNIEVEIHGNPDGIPILFVAGLATQLTSWPKDWIKGFTALGYRLIFMDNRDIGLSSKISEAGIPDITALRGLSKITASDVPYTLDDMADDVAAVLDELNIETVHMVGKSMGGMILQAFMFHHAHRLRSATLMVTTSGAPNLSAMSPEADAALFPNNFQKGEREAVIDATLAADNIWSSPDYPFDKEQRRQLNASNFDRNYDPSGVARQTAALLEYGSKYERLKSALTPSLVVQGMADTIFGSDHGRDLAARLQNSQLLEMPGMGHDLEGDAIQIVFSHITKHLGKN